MYRFLRMLFFIPQPKITPDEAIGIAVRFFEKKKIKIDRPRLFEQLRSWHVVATAHIKGMPWVTIDNQDGHILKYGEPMRRITDYDNM